MAHSTVSAEVLVPASRELFKKEEKDCKIKIFWTIYKGNGVNKGAQKLETCINLKTKKNIKINVQEFLLGWQFC